MKLRRAVLADAPVVTERWAAMFAELGAASADDALRRNFSDYLSRKLPSNDFAAWVIEDRGEVLATAAVILYEIPGRADITHEAYVINVYTVPEARGRGLAQQLMSELISHVKKLPVRKLWLRTAPLARPVYERVGFQVRPEMMELDLLRS